MHRRGFFAAVASSWVLLNGRIGRIAYCRASSNEWLRFARGICRQTKLIGEVDPAGVPGDAGAVFLGSKATLIVGQGGCRVLS